MSEVTITFLGATETVTGSRFLVTTAKSKVLVDCGMFQGTKEIRKKNWEPFPVDVSTIDAVVLTHAHLDHCGYLPLLVRQGYKKADSFNSLHQRVGDNNIKGLGAPAGNGCEICG